MRQVVDRAGPVAYDGEYYQLPYAGEGSTGLGKALKSTVHPLRRDIPIFLGAEGPKNVALAAEICDGWLALAVSRPATTTCTEGSWPTASAVPAPGGAWMTSRWWRPPSWCPATTWTPAPTSYGR